MAKSRVMRERDDGDFDWIEIDHRNGDVETFSKVIPAAEKEYPDGVPPLSEFEERNRQMRNGELIDTDWWGVSDRTMSQAEKDYRQALRDITSHSNWPRLSDEDWPTKPS